MVCMQMKNLGDSCDADKEYAPRFCISAFTYDILQMLDVQLSRHRYLWQIF